MTAKKRMVWWLIVPAVLVAAVWPAGYFYSLTLPAVLHPSPPEYRPDGQVPLGGSAVITVVCDLPLWSPPPGLQVTPPENMVNAGTVQVRGAWRWGWKRWTLQAELRPFRPGAATGGQVVLSAGEAAPVTWDLPGWTVESLPPDRSDPVLAEALPEPSASRFLWYGGLGLILLLAAAALVWCFRRHREKIRAPQPVWERAEQELQSLDQAIRTRQIGMAAAFTRLTEVVRGYLEARYQLPARVQTTGEFLASLERHDTALPPDCRPFLRRFLQAADLVKFARQEPEEERLLTAVEEARSMVRQSIPAETPEKEGKDV